LHDRIYVLLCLIRLGFAPFVVFWIIIFFSQPEPSMTDEKTANEDSSHSSPPKGKEPKMGQSLEKRISSPEPRQDRDSDDESYRSARRRQKNDCHPYRARSNAKRPGFRGSTYRPNYDRRTEHPTNSRWCAKTEDRPRRWDRDETRREDDLQLGEHYARDARLYPREMQYDAKVSDRQRKYDSWCPRR